MALLNLVPNKTTIDFVAMRSKSFFIVAVSTIIFMLSLMFKGLNYGIDFKGGLVIELRTPKRLDLEQTRQNLGKLGLGDVALQEFGQHHDLLIKVENPKTKDGAQEQVIEKIKKTLGKDVQYRKIETVGPKVGAEMVRNGLIAIAVALIGILMYIAFRFEWRFSLCAILALAHDCFLVMGLFSLFPLEFNETAITAILITASYSINDTIVVFDRIRENIRFHRELSLAQIINKSINETLSRTILTVFTTILSVLALFFFGGKVICVFVTPIMIALIIGTLSSIFVAAPLLLFFDVKHGAALEEEEQKRKKEIANENYIPSH
jgi:preprotein translocase subunit SecF